LPFLRVAAPAASRILLRSEQLRPHFPKTKSGAVREVLMRGPRGSWRSRNVKCDAGLNSRCGCAAGRSSKRLNSGDPANRQAQISPPRPARDRPSDTRDQNIRLRSPEACRWHKGRIRPALVNYTGKPDSFFG